MNLTPVTQRPALRDSQLPAASELSGVSEGDRTPDLQGHNLAL